MRVGFAISPAGLAVRERARAGPADTSDELGGEWAAKGAASSMAADLFFVGGLVLGGLALLSFLAANVERHRPWLALVLGLIAVASVVYAERIHPGGYGPRDVPAAVIRLLAHVFN